MDADTSSANPDALFSFATTGVMVSAELEAAAARLQVALDEFAATCREYQLGINGSAAIPLRDHARRIADHALWVRHVADQFVLADQGTVGEADGSVMGTLQIATPVSEWDIASKIEAALERTIARLPLALANQLRALLTPENIATVAVILAVWAASHAIGAGEVVDIILAVGGLIMLGPEAIRAVGDLAAFATGAVGAQSEADLDSAGEHLAEAIAVVGVDGAMALLAHKASGSLGGDMPRLRPSSDAALVTPEGVRLPVSELDNARSFQVADIENVRDAVAVDSTLDVQGAEAGAEHANAHGFSVRDVNPGYGEPGHVQNCVNCVVATDATLDGRPAMALPSAGPKPVSVLEQTYKAKFVPVSGAAEIEQTLQAAGPGARGIIFGYRDQYQAGHVFNVINQDGIIRFIDGQIGGEASFKGFTRFYLLRTN